MAFSFRLKLLRLKYILPGEIAVPIYGYGKIIRQTDPILRNQNNEYFIIACKSLCFLNCIIIYLYSIHIGAQNNNFTIVIKITFANGNVQLLFL